MPRLEELLPPYVLQAIALISQCSPAYVPGRKARRPLGIKRDDESYEVSRKERARAKFVARAEKTVDRKEILEA